MNQAYRLRDRFTEISSHMGLVLVAIATYLGYHADPADPMRFATPILTVLGSFGVAIPEQKASQTTEQVVQLVLKALEESKKAAVASAIAIAIAGSVVLSACQPAAVQPSSSSAPAVAPAVNSAQVIYYLQSAGCLGEILAGAAAPVVTIAADAKGGQVLQALGAGAGNLCQVTVPASALPAPAPAGAPPAVVPVAVPAPSPAPAPSVVPTVVKPAA